MGVSTIVPRFDMCTILRSEVPYMVGFSAVQPEVNPFSTFLPIPLYFLNASPAAHRVY